MFWKKSKNKESVLETVTEIKSVDNVSAKSNQYSYAPKNIMFPGQDYLKFEESNDYVKYMQQNLISIGYEIPGGANGVYGIATVKAVKKYYDDNGLGSNTGNHIGPKAWNKLFGNY